MLTSEDINKLIDAMKAFFYTKEEMDVKFENIENNFSILQTSVDAFAKTVNDTDQEVSALGNRVDNIDTWVQEAAPIIGLKYKV